MNQTKTNLKLQMIDERVALITVDYVPGHHS